MVLPKQLTNKFNIRNRKKAVITITLKHPVRFLKKPKQHWWKKKKIPYVQEDQKLISDYFKPVNSY